MKTLALALLLAPIFLGGRGAGCATTGTAQPSLVIRLAGDPLAHTAETQRAARTLETLPGVQRVTISAATGELAVERDPALADDATLVLALEKEGFRADSAGAALATSP